MELNKGDFMEFIIFLIVGLIAGWIANVIVKGHGAGVFLNMITGVVGAFVGGYVYRFFGVTSDPFFGSLGMSVVGSVIFLLLIGMVYKGYSGVKHSPKV